jgi:hypothetical protein
MALLTVIIALMIVIILILTKTIELPSQLKKIFGYTNYDDSITHNY